MHVAIDARNIFDPAQKNYSGMSLYTYTLVYLLANNSKHKYTVIIPQNFSDKKTFELPNIELIEAPDSAMPLMGSHFAMNKLIQEINPDWFHSPTASLPLGIEGKTIVTVHDLAIYINPKWFPKGQWFATKMVVPHSIKSATKIIAVSEATKKDCISTFEIEPEKIMVVHNTLPIIKHEEAEKKGLPSTKEKYILSISTLEPRKNYQQIFKSFLLLKEEEQFKDLRLYVIGSEGWRIKDVFKNISRAQLEKQGVLFISSVTEKQKKEYIKNAELVFFPSLYEGFGMPILETLQYSANNPTPIITSNVSAMPEIAGDAALLVEPNNLYQIHEALKTALTDQKARSKIKEGAKKQRKQFSQEKFIKQILKTYEN